MLEKLVKTYNDKYTFYLWYCFRWNKKPKNKMRFILDQILMRKKNEKENRQ